MRAFLLGLALLLPVTASAAAPPKAFSADYEVFQNGEKLGTGSISLRALPDGRWELHTRSRATEGLFAMAGVERSERSVIAWNGGQPEVVEYRMQQKAGWSERSQLLRVDAGARTVSSTYKDQTTVLPYSPGLIDKHGVTAAIMSDLAAGRRGELAYTVAERRAVEPQRFRTAANVKLRTALGQLRAVRVERVRDGGDGRVTRIWFARERGWLPLRITQVEADGETLDMRITAIR
ncbi:DUF3108 domain-containing protein [Arenimonas daejeonensis]|uniref:DUF3108 domain-containing protein n=1 Tax=Arenimonas daejeonensis TaxID=370777 RepID=UPI00131558E5|nr:DUF3108 domain-containing protein [Arenimonas daejeonensis]